MPFTYILRCADDTLYVGCTEDLASREQTHNEGRRAVYTATGRPVRMVYAERHPVLTMPLKGSAIQPLSCRRLLRRGAATRGVPLLEHR